MTRHEAETIMPEDVDLEPKGLPEPEINGIETPTPISRRRFLGYLGATTIFLPGLLKNGAFGPTNSPTEAPPTATITPTPTEVAPPSPTPEQLQEPVRLDQDDVLFLAYSGRSFWKRAGRALKTSPLQGDYVASIKNSKGEPVDHILEAEGKQYVVSAQELDPGAIMKIIDAQDGQIPAQVNQIVDQNNPLVVTSDMAGALPDGAIVIPIAREDQEIVFEVKMHADPKGPIVTKPYGSLVSVENGPSWIGFNVRNDRLSLVVSNSVVQRFTNYTVDPEFDGRPLRVLFAPTKDKIQITDLTGKVLPIIDQSGNKFEWLDLEERNFRQSRVWKASVQGSANNLTIDNLSLHTRTLPNSDEPSVNEPELEIGNGLATYASSVTLPFGTNAFSPLSVNISHLMRENASSQEGGTGGVDFNQSSDFANSGLGDPNGPPALDPWPELTDVNWLKEHGFSHTGLPLDVINVTEKRTSRTSLIQTIQVLADGMKDDLTHEMPIRGLFTASGGVDTKIPWLKNYSNSPDKFLDDVVPAQIEAGTRPRFIFPKSSASGIDRMWATVTRQQEKKRAVAAVQIDIGGLTNREAIDRILQMKATGLEIDIDRVADNSGGLTVEQELDIFVFTGARRQIAGVSNPLSADPTQIYAFETNADLETKYTSIYTRYRDKLKQIQGVQGRLLVISNMIRHDPHYFDEMRKAAKENPKDKRWETLQRAHKGIDFDAMVDTAL